MTDFAASAKASLKQDLNEERPKHKCEDCGATIDTTTGITLQVGCRAIREASPCSKCHRLHFLCLDEASAVVQRGGAKAYLIDEKLVHKE